MMKAANAQEITVPQFGLADGIMHELHFKSTKPVFL